MRLLLDTHIFLWVVSDSERLKPPARRLIETADAVYVSAASIWEIAIKARLGKIDADADELVAAIDASGFAELPVRAVHSAQVSRITRHHNDPFDHLLLAQAMTEPLRLLSADSTLRRYTDLVIAA